MFHPNFIHKLSQLLLQQSCSLNFLANPNSQCLKSLLLPQIRWKSGRAHLDHSKVPKLDESDLVEQFVRGSGPGGQATAKTCNAVVLKHKPSGIVVKCHETRSMWENKKRARDILITKLDNMINGKDSLENQEKALLAKKSANRSRKREKMLALKTAFKEREGID